MDSPDPSTPPRLVIGPFLARHLWAMIGSLVAVGALLVAVTIPSSGQRGLDVAPAPAGDFYAIGAPGTGLSVGDRPPPLATVGDAPIVDLDGEVVEVGALAGRPVWILFWTSWCPPCQAEMPDIQRAWEASAGSGLEIVAMNVQETGEIATEYAETYGLTFRIGLDPAGAAFRNWAVFGLPTHYFIDRDGVIRDRWFGPLALQDMEERISLIGGS